MKKLFTSDKFFLAMVLCAVIGKAAYAILNIFFYGYALQSQLTLLFNVACVIVLYSSYKCHSKNVMKGMMGALLAAQCIISILYLSEITISADYVCLPLFAVFSTLIFINHFIINADRKASPIMIKLNQILVLLLFVDNTALGVLRIISNPFSVVFSALFLIFIFDVIGYLGITATIVCVESRLDAYRLDREAAGWTEEAGYPEGYVHEYEKKDNK